MSLNLSFPKHFVAFTRILIILDHLNATIMQTPQISIGHTSMTQYTWILIFLMHKILFLYIILLSSINDISGTINDSTIFMRFSSRCGCKYNAAVVPINSILYVPLAIWDVVLCNLLKISILKIHEIKRKKILLCISWWLFFLLLCSFL